MCYMNNSTKNERILNMNLLTAKDVANLFKIEVETVYQWKFYGKIKSVKVNGRLLFKEEDIINMVA